MLGQLETDTIALNGYTDATKAPEDYRRSATASSKRWRTSSLTLKADLGIFSGIDGERLTVVDETGHVLLRRPTSSPRFACWSRRPGPARRWPCLSPRPTAD